MSFPIQIEKLVYGGRGLARFNGRVVLAPFVLPSETVLVEPEKDSRDLIYARTVAVESPAEYRVPPPCPVFGRCGGCHYQHMPYEQQLEFKRGILLETLTRIGKIDWSGSVEIVAAEPWEYRNRTQLHVRKPHIGYFHHGSHQLVPMESCPISSPGVNRAIAALVRMGPDPRFPDFLRSIELFTNEREIILTVLDSARPLGRRFFDWCAAEIEGFRPAHYLEYPVGPDMFHVSSRSFFQINRFLLPRLPGLVVPDQPGQVALDLYAGVGLFSIPLARRFSRVIAVDSSGSATQDLKINAQRAGVPVEIHHQPAERFLETLGDRPDLVVADPPRSGLGHSVTASLARLRPQRLTIVSCDPATLARDLRPLLSSGFEIFSIKLVDLFPQTFHIETVVELITEN